AYYAGHDTRAACSRGQCTQEREEDQRSSRHKDNQGRLRGYGRNNERHHGSNGKATSRRERSLNRPRSERFIDREFVAGMCPYGVVGHDVVLVSLRDGGTVATSIVDFHHFPALAFFFWS